MSLFDLANNHTAAQENDAEEAPETAPPVRIDVGECRISGCGGRLVIPAPLHPAYLRGSKIKALCSACSFPHQVVRGQPPVPKAAKKDLL